MRRLLCCLVLAALLGAAGPAAAQDEYGVLPDSIPDTFTASPLDALRYGTGTPAVLRLHSERLVVENSEESTLYVHRVVTVYQKEGREHGRLVLPYDSFMEIEDIDGRVLDADGNEVTDLGDEHLSDFSGTRTSLYTDFRVRVARMLHDSYPYTVEYWYEVDVTSALRWPDWHPDDSAMPTELTQFTVEVSPEVDFRYHTRGNVPTPRKSLTNGGTAMQWRAANRPAYRRQPHGPQWREQAPVLKIAPKKFTISGVEGDMSTWESFGKWYFRLKASRDDLPDAAADQIREVVKGAATKRDSVRRVYRHLQKTTRYVSVQLGIGGWQPFPASYVLERGYGDCKALTNYMEAALKAIGIPSHPVLIYRGFDPPPLETDFPDNQFNHAILAVPVEQDTLWLENTDQTAPFAHVAADIENRHALLVSPEGGTLVRIPSSTAGDNRQRRAATVKLDAQGNGRASVQTTYTGDQQDMVRRRLAQRSSRDRRKWMRNHVSIPSFEIQSADFDDVDAYRDSVTLGLEMTLPRYASKTGSRLFVHLNLMERWVEVPKAMDTTRTQPIEYWPFPFSDVDSIRYTIPDGYRVEAMPDTVRIDTEFASYEAAVTVEDGVLVYRRFLEWRTRSLPPDRYDAFRSFLRRVSRSDNAQAVLVKEKT